MIFFNNLIRMRFTWKIENKVNNYLKIYMYEWLYIYILLDILVKTIIKKGFVFNILIRMRFT